MFEILLFIFENYPQIELAPGRSALAIKLNAAGFHVSEIEQVLNWLGELQFIQHDESYPLSLMASQSARVYSMDEQQRLEMEGMGFLTYIQQSGMINPLQREWIVNQVMALKDDEQVDEKLRWITLVVLWSQHPDQSMLWLEDMLFNHNAAPTMH